jgi:superkiller protein 3
VALRVLAGSAGWVMRDQTARQAKIATEVRAALEESRQLRQEGKLPRAEAAAKRAEALLASGGGNEELQERMHELWADLRMVAKLEEVSILRSGVRDGYFDSAGGDRGYAAAFRDYGIDVEALDPVNAAERIGARAIRVELAAALDGWAGTRRPQQGQKSGQDLLAIARAADPDPSRAALRDAVLREDGQDLVQRAASEEIHSLPPTTLVLLAKCLAKMGNLPEATALLRRAQEQHPGDFWINHTLAHYLVNRGTPHWDEAIPFYTAAVALRPESPGARLNLGNALAATGQLDAALAAYRRAASLKPDYAEAHCNLGLALADKGRLDEALATVRQAIALKPHLAEGHCNLGLVLQKKGRLDEAVAAYRRATELKPGHARFHNNLGGALADQGRLDEALNACRKAIDLKGDYPEAYSNLGLVLQRKGRLDEAVTACRQAIALKRDYATAHFNLGLALFGQGRFDEALAAYHKAIDLKPDYAEAHCNLGFVLQRKGRLDEAVAAYRRATELKPDLALAHFNLGLTLQRKGRPGEAIDVYRRVLALKPDYAEVHYDLGNALLGKGRLDKAVAAYHRAIGLKPDYAEAYCNLACALRQQGEYAQALTAMKQGHELGRRRSDWPYPSARWVKEYQRLSELEGRLPAVLRGEVQPVDAAERNTYALLCYDKKLYAAAARMRNSALTADPKLADDLEAGYRYDAACAAALAGCGQGEGADDKEPVHWRRQALECLRADLAAYGQRLESGKPGDRQLVRQRLRGWQGHQDLAGLRDPDAVAKLPADEQKTCQQLWAEVQALLTKAEAAQ